VAQRKRTYVVVTMDRGDVAIMHEVQEVENTQDGLRWIKKHGDAERRYRVIAVTQDWLTVSVEVKEVRRIAEPVPAPAETAE